MYLQERKRREIVFIRPIEVNTSIWILIRIRLQYTNCIHIAECFG